MILSRNWICFKGFSLKLGFGIGIGLGSAYFLNNINCDAPAKILQQDTGIEFDERIQDFKILGVGVRQVTFIKFNAYAAALYIQNKSLENLGSRWKEEYTPDKLLKTPESTFFINDLLKKGNSLKLVIKTCRNTDGPHLRNGFLKMLNLQYKSCNLNNQEKEAVDKDLLMLKSSWPVKGTFKKGDTVIVTRDVDESLSFEFPDNPELFGFKINNSRLSRWFFQSYIGDFGISESLRKNVSIGLQKLLY